MIKFLKFYFKVLVSITALALMMSPILFMGLMIDMGNTTLGIVMACVIVFIEAPLVVWILKTAVDNDWV